MSRRTDGETSVAMSVDELHRDHLTKDLECRTSGRDVKLGNDDLTHEFDSDRGHRPSLQSHEVI